MRLTTATLICAIALTACATRQESASSRAMRLTMGMDKDQVVAVMGAPRKTSAKMMDAGLSERYFWWSPTLMGLTYVDNEMLAQDRVFVRFVNGKVVEWGDKYDYSSVMENLTDAQREALKAAFPARAASAP